MLEIEKEKEGQDKAAEKKYRVNENFAMKQMLKKQFSAVFNRFLSAENILEVGCGVGDFLLFCKMNNKDQIVGIDISKKAIEIANKRLVGCGFSPLALEGNVYSLPEMIKDKKVAFDCVVMRGVTHHLKYPASAFENIYNSLIPEGRLIIIEGNITSFYRRTVLRFADLLHVAHELSGFPHLAPVAIRKELEKTGFCNVEIAFMPGFFTPLAYLGIGGSNFWRGANILEDRFFCKIAPRFFGWWFILSACKRNRKELKDERGK